MIKEILLILIIPILLYSYNPYSYQNSTARENDINYERLKMERYEFQEKLNEKRKKQTAKNNKRRREAIAAKKQKRVDANSNARKANEEYYKSQNNSSVNNNEEVRHAYVKPTYNPKDFKDQAQIKLDNLHILGVISIKSFKGNKVIIKAANGTFALPKEKFEQAEKINFTKELMQN